FQGLLAFALGLLTPGYWLAVTIYLSLTGMAVSVMWPDVRRVTAAALLGLALSTHHLVVSWGWGTFFQNFPALGLALAFVVVYVVTFTRQTQARERAQALLHELEIAHRRLRAYADRVEELTISQERQRMAQELHDTLAQGLTGLLMQLEAVDIHLDNDNTAKAQETVQQAMVRTRTTLREARRAIQALRPAVLEQTGLINALSSEVDAFEARTGIHATFQVNAGALDVSLAIAQDILRIVQESLTNVGQHAEAENVIVSLETRGAQLRVVIEDDGRGFDPELVAGPPDSFGQQGMRERAEHVGGDLQVRSVVGKGTTVTLEMEMPS
ncbi:MAG: sensor histidine kinase, partial [Anaerolineae bacterium]|nr:sensor histidine kinase [Anaerolineae bacterium]